MPKLFEMQERNPAVLVLEDGTFFEGKAIGITGKTSGEIAFNTGMTGYQEVFTDPSYLGQILIMTTSHIGNYGVHEDELESTNMKISGIVIKKFSDIFSRASGKSSLEQNLIEDGKLGISDIDTRALVRYIRNKGAMNAIISTEPNYNIDSLKEEVKNVPSMEGLELSSQVCTKFAFEKKATVESKYRVALMDFGVKMNIIRCLNERGCDVMVYPMTATVTEMLEYKPDGFMLSNGPGDPSAMPKVIENIKAVINNGKPVFGICLGHQLIGLSQGLRTEKMFNGHRGLNHPIKNLLTGKGEITSQNHGFVISKESIEENNNVELTHIHLNDDSVAGIRLKNQNVFSVQYHPEASAGPHDSRYLFDQFVDNLKKS